MKRLIFILILLVCTISCTDYEELCNNQRSIITLQNQEILELRRDLGVTQDSLDALQRLYDERKICPDIHIFENKDALQNFLAQDDTDQQTFVTDNFTCVDFSFRLINAAQKQGYLMFPYVIVEHAHMICEVLVYNDLSIDVYFIEPQTDDIALGGWFERNKYQEAE